MITVPKDNKWLLDRTTGQMLDPETCAFNSDEEMHQVQRMKEYQTDPSLRLLCSKMIENRMKNEAAAKVNAPSTVVSGRELARAMSDPEGARKQVLREIANEHAQNLFMAKDEQGRLKYEHSPSYREEVRQWLIDHNDEIDSVMGDRFVDRTAQKVNTKVRVELGNGSAQSIRDEQAAYRALADKKTIQEKHDRVDAGRSSEAVDLGGIRS